MNNLKEYIIEKFKINKDTIKSSKSHLFKKGDPIYRLSIRTSDWLFTIGFNRLPKLVFFIRKKENRVCFLSNKPGQEEAWFTGESVLIENNNSFYEAYGRNKADIPIMSVYLNCEDAIYVLENILLNFENRKKELKDYFNDTDEIDYSKLHLNDKYTKEFIQDSLNEFKKYKKEHEKS